ncbi:MAG: hypothetical protein COV52_09965 [Gammaproteobacteria bacterium CG11_big_fil_rev_8_21_14_0_20_46_22]|nr:MAG: hypothetical protein COW05_05130 [Gammaproteobacteria bacterium CG12_big_fil_rev_8_21_14_0_65_46_12]PIR10148.1 MAG: hypothetical protein COV52_09965 [Gammaproteobacteria bacterium CG11_big_fil_rev_8_21_14_0_20_46_22]
MKYGKRWSLFHYTVYDANYFIKLKSFLENPKRYLKKHPLAQMKKDKPATLYALEFNDSAFVIKRFHLRSFGYWLSHCFKKTRAEHCWHAAELFEKYHLPTPHPVLLRVNHFLGLQLGGYYVCEYIKGETLVDYIARTRDFSMIDQAVSIIKAMHAQKISHGDLKATNFIHRDGQLYLIDLDAVKKRLTVFERFRRKDVNRFIKNWRDDSEIMALESIRSLG